MLNDLKNMLSLHLFLTKDYTCTRTFHLLDLTHEKRFKILNYVADVADVGEGPRGDFPIVLLKKSHFETICSLAIPPLFLLWVSH